MAVTSGFFDSYNHDRLYSAEDVGSLLDGIITDGILNSYGGHFAVRQDTGLNVIVSSGRGWFKHTWIKNDGDLTLTAEPNTADANRTDTVVIDVNKNDSVRANTIQIVRGGLSTTTTSSAISGETTANYGEGETETEVRNPPTLLSASGHWQYPLCDIVVGAQSSTITEVIDRRGEIYASSPLFAKPYYPVGAIYISGAYDDQNNPASMFGGVWKRIAGRFLIGCGTDEYLENNVDSGLAPGPGPSGRSIADFTYTIEENNLPEHRHNINLNSAGANANIRLVKTNDPTAERNSIMGWANPSLDDGGGGTSDFSNYLPGSWDTLYSQNGGDNPDYEVTKVRTSYSTQQVSAYDFGHSHLVNGLTENSGAGEKITIAPPYVAVHMWIRVS